MKSGFDIKKINQYVQVENLQKHIPNFRCEEFTLYICWKFMISNEYNRIQPIVERKVTEPFS